VIRSNILLQKVQVHPSAHLSILLKGHHSQHCPALYFLRISHHLPVSRKDGTLWLSASMFCGSGAICLLALKFLLYLSSRWLTAFFSRFYETLLYNDRRALRNPYIGPSSHMPVKTARSHRHWQVLSLQAPHDMDSQRYSPRCFPSWQICLTAPLFHRRRSDVLHG